MQKRAVHCMVAALLLSFCFAGCSPTEGIGTTTTTTVQSSNGTDNSQTTGSTKGETTTVSSQETPSSGDVTTTTAVATSSTKVQTTTTTQQQDQLPKALWDQFHIYSYFAFGGSGDRVMYDKVIRQTKAAYFTGIEITNVDTADPSPDSAAVNGVRTVIRTALDVCRDYGMAAIVADPYLGGGGTGGREIEERHVKQTLDAYADYNDVIAGYLLWDEPQIEQFSTIRQRIGWIRKYDESVRLYMNLLPSYGKYTWKDFAYRDYVDTFIRNAGPEMLSVDYYVFGHQTDCNQNVLSVDQGLWRDMGLFRKRAAETGKPFEFYIQGVGDFSANKAIGNMTPERIAFQMYAALTYGVKRVSYFTSYGLLLDANGDPTKYYEEVQAINKEALAVGQFLYDKESVALYHSGVGAMSKVQDIMYLDSLADSDLLTEIPTESIVSVFEGTSGDRYVMVANKRYDWKATGKLSFKEPVTLRLFDASTGQMGEPIVNTTAVTVDIPAGGYLLYQIG